jgi:site-specific recombinase XerD
LTATRNHNWDSIAKHLHQFTRGKLSFGSLNDEWLTRFQDYLCTRVQASTARNYMGLLLAGINQAVRDKRLPTNPAPDVRKVRVKEKPPKCLSKEQVELLLQNRQDIPDWLVQAFQFSCYTGFASATLKHSCGVKSTATALVQRAG